MGLSIIPLIPISHPCMEGLYIVLYHAHTVQNYQHLALQTVQRQKAAHQADSVCNMAILEAMSSGLQLSKSTQHFQPTAAGTAWRGTPARAQKQLLSGAG